MRRSAALLVAWATTDPRSWANGFGATAPPSSSSSFAVRAALHDRRARSRLFVSFMGDLGRGDGGGGDTRRYGRRVGIEIPLFVPSDDDDEDDANNAATIPLPSAHLPDELSTLNMYSLKTRSAARRRLVEAAGASESRCYGHVVDAPNEGTLVGAVGCAAEILVTARPVDEATNEDVPNASDVSVLVRGSWRFVVREVVSEFPYPVAVVDELTDEDPNETTVDEAKAEEIGEEIAATTTTTDDGPIFFDDFAEENLVLSLPEEEEEGDDDDDDDSEDELVPEAELVPRTLAAARALVEALRALPESETTPLEDHILESAGVVATPSSTRPDPFEMSAVLDVFASETQVVTPYATAFLAAEIADADNAARRDMIIGRDAVARSRTVLRLVESAADEARAHKLATELTSPSPGETDERELRVGAPTMPDWVNRLKVGMRVEYFWNEEWGWCEGTIEKVERMFDEIIVDLKFKADGETHRLPVTPEDKIRWRPAQ